MIFDTNVLIFVSKNILKITDILSPDVPPSISVISFIEALGYPFKSLDDEHYMKMICSSCTVIDLNDLIIAETIKIRKKHKIKLPDAIIYATALIEGKPLLTNNTDDFKKLGGQVKLIDPFNL